MKRYILIFAVAICFSTIIFFGCTKTNNFESPVTSEFAAEVQSWFNTDFINTSEYKKGTNNGYLKIPNWNYGKVYKIGNIDVVEFPLNSSKKKVYITENLTEADARKVVDATKFKAIFFKAPGKNIEVRIIEFIPSFKFLKSKSFNINNISFEDYRKEFKGSFLMFDFNDNLIKGYKLTDDKTRTLRFDETARKKIKINDKGSNTIEQSLCDNLPDPNPNCIYDIVTEYEIICGGGWNPAEGFNPSYCTLNVVVINCYLVSCELPSDDPYEACLTSGGSAEECNCSVYGIGCGGGGPNGDPTACDPNAVSNGEQEFNNYIEMNQSTISDMINTSVGNVGQENCDQTTWDVAWGTYTTWKIKAVTDYCYTKTLYGTTNGFAYEYNISYLKTGRGFYEGTNALINSTYTQINDSYDNIYNNNSRFAYGRMHVVGSIEHKYNVIAQLPFCAKLLSNVKTVDGYKTLMPQ